MRSEPGANGSSRPSDLRWGERRSEGWAGGTEMDGGRAVAMRGYGVDENRERALEEVAAEIRRCRACELHRGRRRAVPGEGSGRSRIVVVGEAPGAKEDARGRPFVGSAGKLLDRALRLAGLARSDVFITNVVKCRPPGNRPPKRAEVRACAAHLRRQLELLGPALVCTMGNSALRALVDPKGSITSMRGRLVVRDGVRYLPTYHLAAVLYRRKLIQEMEEDFRELGRVARELGLAGQSRLRFEDEEGHDKEDNDGEEQEE